MLPSDRTSEKVQILHLRIVTRMLKLISSEYMLFPLIKLGSRINIDAQLHGTSFSFVQSFIGKAMEFKRLHCNT